MWNLIACNFSICTKLIFFILVTLENVPDKMAFWQEKLIVDGNHIDWGRGEHHKGDMTVVEDFSLKNVLVW